MPSRTARSYTLTPALVADHIGAGVMCFAAEGLGRRWALYPERPGASFNRRVTARRDRVSSRDAVTDPRTDLPSGANHAIAAVAPSPALIRVDLSGPLEQFAGYQDPCGGWTDGHDALCERLCAAFEEGDVLLVINSPGGAAAGLQQGVARALKAKAHHGRTVTGWINEMSGSAATWWSMAVCDRIFLPEAGQAGSIGARGEHTSIAGMLAREGVEKTYFADPPDKIAFAPEFPLSPAGEARGNRDVRIAADAFRAAVCSSPLGMRAKLTPEILIALGADMLTGQAAVDAGLADGVATEDDVIEMALAQAENGGAEEGAETRARDARGAPGMKIRTEDDPKDARAGDDDPPPSSKPGEPSEPEKGKDPSTKCSSCEHENDKTAKYCDQCGESMAAKPVAKDEDEPKEKAALAAPPAMREDAGLARIVNASGDSMPAIVAGAIKMRQAYDTAARVAAGILGKAAKDLTPGAIVGALLTVPERLKAGADAAAVVAKGEKQERWDLASRLNKLGLDGWPRHLIFRDEVGTDGKRKAVELKPAVAAMDLDVLRGMVEGFEASAKPKTPWEAGREQAKTGAAAHEQRERAASGQAPMLPSGEPSKEAIDAAVNDPAVVALAKQTGRDPRAVAASYLKTRAMNGAQNGMV